VEFDYFMRQMGTRSACPFPKITRWNEGIMTREVVVEAPRVEGKDLDNEFKSIASEGFEGDCVIG
jgi:hypothetical protein